MKILEIIHGLNPGGAERLVVDLCNEMSKTEDVTLLLIKDLNKGQNGFYLQEVSKRVKVICLKFEDGFHLSYLHKVYRTISKINPNIVHIHCVLNYCMLALLLDSKNRKYYQTLHIDIEHIKTSHIYNIAFRLFGKRNLLKIAAISKTNYDECIAEYPKVTCRCIFNGRDVQNATNRYDDVKKELSSFRQSKSSLLLLNVARCDEQKNHKRLIEAIEILNEEGFDVSAIVIGNGYFDTQLGEELRKMNNHNVHFLGPKKNVVDYMLATDAFCMSSDYEGMPITIIEAMLNGKFIISTPVCGVIDVINHGVNGLLSDAFTAESLAQEIKKYIKNKEVFDASAKKQIENCPYNIANCAKGYIDYFDC